MATVTSTQPALTAEQVLAMPDDGVERELIRGELRERPWTPRDHGHGLASARVASALDGWLDRDPSAGGEVLCGGGFLLAHDPESGVAIDIAYVSTELSAATPESATFIDGPPLLAVEILSPSDKLDEVEEKVGLYLESGVKLVWVLSPRYRTVTVYGPGAEPVLFNALQELADEPLLPGFRVPVASLFSR